MDIQERIRRAEEKLEPVFREIDRIEEIRTRRILDIFRDNGVSYRHFAPTTGYGYDDIGRDTLEKIYADVFHTEAFDCVELKDGKIQTDAVEKAIRPETSLVIAQRSRGYADRPSLMPEAFESLAEMIHKRHPGVRLMVDNCYGEFVRESEPTDFGADVCVGSIIKNPGGGIAPTGGYVVGSREAVDRVAWRLTAPGLGRELGSYAGDYRLFYQGLFMAPHTVAQALKTAQLAAALFEELGMKASPAAGTERADIIQSIRMETGERLVAFCQGLQTASPVDSMALPEPWNMPGYDDPVVMAAGTFVAGASIELSADGPMREPYIAFMQGGLTYAHGKIALAEALDRMIRVGALKPES